MWQKRSKRSVNVANRQIGGMEPLEIRRLLTTVRWDGGGDGTSWTDAANWNAEGSAKVPEPGDDVIIDLNAGTPYTVNVNVNIAAGNGLGSLTLNSPNANLAVINRSFTIDGATDIQAGSLDLFNTTWNGSDTFQLAGTMSARGTVQINAPSVQDGNVLVRSDGFGTRLTVDGGFVNNGSIVVDNSGSPRTSLLAVTNGSLVNEATGTMQFVAEGAEYSFLGNLENHGTIDIDNNVRFSQSNSVVTNNETIVVGQDAKLTFANNTTFQQNQGRLEVQGIAEAVNADFIFLGGTLEGSQTLVHSDLTIGQSAVEAAEFTLQGNSTIAGDVSERQTIRIEAAGANTNVRSPQSMTNAGTIILERTSGIRDPRFELPNGQLINAPTGMIQVAAGNGGTVTIAADLINQGTFTAEAATVIRSGLTTNSGSFSSSEGATINFADAGTNFSQTAGSLNIQGGFTMNGGEFNASGGTMNVHAELSSSALHLAPDAAGGTFVLRGNSNMSGDIGAEQAIIVANSAGGGSGILTINNTGGITNRGSILLDPISTRSVTLNVTNGQLTNATTGTIRTAEVGTAIIDGDIVNDGTIELLTDTRFDGNSTHNNEELTIGPNAIISLGTVTADHLFVQANGILDVQGVLNVSADTFDFNGGFIGGEVSLFNGLLNLNTSNGGAFVFFESNNALNGNISDQQTVTIRPFGRFGGRLDAGLALANFGMIILDGADATSGPILAAEGEFRNLGELQVNASSGGRAAIDADLQNFGLMTLENDLQVITKESQPTNEGDIVLIESTLSFTGPQASFSNAVAGNIGGSGTIDVADASFTNAGLLSPGIDEEAASLSIDGDTIFESTSRVFTEIGGRTPDDDYDRLEFTDRVALDGSLIVRVIDGFSPVQGDRFEVLSFGSSNGAFADFDGLSIAGSQVFAVDTSDAQAIALELGNAVSDLQIESVAIPDNALAGQPVSVTYSVVNQGEATTSESWRDSVYLSDDEIFDPLIDQLLTRVDRVGDLAAGESYTETVSATIPGVIPGEYFVFAVPNSSRDIPETNFENNVVSSGAAITIDVEPLELGVTSSRSIQAGQLQFFRFDAPLGSEVQIRRSATAGTILAATSRLQMPAFGATEFESISPFIDDATLALPNTVTGTHFITIGGHPNCGAQCEYELTVSEVQLAIHDSTPTTAGSIGNKTIEIRGSGFDEATQLVAISRSTAEEFDAVSQFLNSGQLSIVFTDLPIGSYDLEARNESGAARLGAALEITDNTNELVNELDFKIIQPSAVRPGRDSHISIEFANNSSTDIPAQMLIFNVEGGFARFPEQDFEESDRELLLFAAQSSGAAQTIPPGYQGTIDLVVRSDSTAEHLNTSLDLIDPATSIIVDESNADPAAVGPLESNTVSNLIGKRLEVITTREIGRAIEFVRGLNPKTPPNEDPAFSVDLVRLGDFSPNLKFDVFDHPEFDFVDGRSDNIFFAPDNEISELTVRFETDCKFVIFIDDNNDRIESIIATDQNGFEHEVKPITSVVDGRVIGFEDPGNVMRSFLEKKERELGNRATRTSQPIVDRNTETNEQLTENVSTATGETTGTATEAILKALTQIRANSQPGNKPNSANAQSIIRNLLNEFRERLQIRSGDASRTGIADFKNNGIKEIGSGKLEVTIFGERFVLDVGRDEGGSQRLTDSVIRGSQNEVFGSRQSHRIDVRITHPTRPTIDAEFRNGQLIAYVYRGERTQLFYDGKGIVNEIRVDNRFFRIDCDDQGRTNQITTTNTDGTVTTQTRNFDTNGHINAVTNHNSGNNIARTHSFVNDSQGRTESVTNPDGSQLTIERALKGTVISEGFQYSYESTNSNEVEIEVRRVQQDGRPTEKVQEATVTIENGRVTRFSLRDKDGHPLGDITDPPHAEAMKVQLAAYPGIGEFIRQVANEKQKAINEGIPENAASFYEELKTQSKPRIKWSIQPSQICDSKKTTKSDDGTCKTVASQTTAVIRPIDPNDIIGPAGFGDENFITKDQTLPYTIRFENKAEATAAAQEVFITQQLDDDLDFSSFRLGDVGFGDFYFDLPDGNSFIQTTFDVRSSLGVLVELTAGIDANSGIATWTFRSLDPLTGDLPGDPFAGFLPPNVIGPEGEGFITYTITPRANLMTGDRIDAQASIVFDSEEAIETPPIFNTIDDGAPVSTITSLPEFFTSSDLQIEWSGADDVGGSGVATFDIFMSKDGGPFELILERTSEDSFQLEAEDGAHYSFFSRAIDNVGIRELGAFTGQASTTIRVSEPGDLDGNGQVDANDIDLLCAGLRNGGGLEFDLNGDGSLGTNDFHFLVREILGTDAGDSNLDGQFNSTDLILAFTAGQFEGGIAANSGWRDGDWNCDGEFGTGDLISAFQSGTFSTASSNTRINQIAAFIDFERRFNARSKHPSDHYLRKLDNHSA